MKKLIRATLRTIPRPALQRMAHLVLPLTGLLYRGSARECPVCNGRFRKFLPYGYEVVRDQALCPRCLSLERHRLMWLYLKRETDFFAAGHKIIHIAPERCFIKRFQRAFGKDYTTADLESPLADLHFNIEAIPLADDSFDIVFCNHTLEHVEDDKKAMGELFRIMRPGGWGIFMVPQDMQLDETYEDPSITTPQGRAEAFGQYDHVRVYGNDYGSRLSEAGFIVEGIHYADRLPAEQRQFYGLKDDIIWRVSKP